MPLIETRELSPVARLGLWRIDDSADASPRRRERSAVLQLLHAMTGDPSLVIDHEPSGKPFVASASSPFALSISVSHTRGYAALIVSSCPEVRVGVDIEYCSDRVDRIARRFIRPDEHADTTSDRLVLWSAKEAVYKCFSEDNLMFHDMRMLSKDGNSLLVENIKRGVVVAVHYELTPDYVLTYVTTP